MGRISKTFALILVLIIVMSCLTLLLVKPVNAQTIAKPSVPEFSLNFIQAYYNTTYPPEGATEIIIKNQPFEPQNNLTQLAYGLRLKGHNDKNWTEVYSTTLKNLYPADSSSENTIIVLPQWGFFVYGQVDFQVDAVIATATPNIISKSWTYNEISNWSNTQTVTVPIFSFSPVPSQSSTVTPTPTAVSSSSSISFLLITNTISLIIIAILLAVIIALLLLMNHRKTTNQTP